MNTQGSSLQPLGELLATPEDERRLVEGSHLYGGGANFQSWLEQRRFIAEAIHRPGTLLDIGCANGFLLRCLMEWSAFPIVPFGIDADEACVRECRRLFPEYGDHVLKLSLAQLSRLPALGLPPTFDFVYWNVWDDFDFSEPWHRDLASQAFGATSSGGRLILGFYDRESLTIEAKVAWLAENFGPVSGRKQNLPRNEVIVWWDRS